MKPLKLVYLLILHVAVAMAGHLFSGMDRLPTDVYWLPRGQNMHKFAVIIGLLAGISLLLYWGGEAPSWLLKLECAGVLLAGLYYGLSNQSPHAPEWFRHDAVRGVLLVYLAVGAMWLDPRFLISAFLLGNGCKLVLRSAVETTARVVSHTLPGGSTDIVIKPEGGITRR